MLSLSARARLPLLLVLLLALLLAGCGFTPLHRAASLPALAISTPANPSGGLLRRELLRLLPVEETAVLRVGIALKRRERDVITRVDTKVIRREISLTASWTIDGQNGRRWQGESTASAVYNQSETPYSPYGNLVAARRAEADAARGLAEKLRGRFAVLLTRE